MSCCPDEEWGEFVPGRYSVSTCGRVRNDKTGRVRNPSMSTGRRGGPGYDMFDWRTEGRRFFRTVHCMVLEAFVGDRPEGLEGLHRDDNRTNNHLSNLYWGTHSDNMQDRIRNGNNPWLNGTARKWWVKDKCSV